MLRRLDINCFQDTNITNCHYTYDTILFLEANNEVIESAWWAMQAFEAVSEIRVNLNKT